MKTLGSHPGAILFRLSVMVVLITILISTFFSYLDNTEKLLEETSVIQTKKVIDSALAVVFSTYAINGRLGDLNQLNGANPFVFLKEYGITPASYVGETDRVPGGEEVAGWYYLQQRGVVMYRPRFNESEQYFAIRLDYEDRNQSGSFEPQSDQFSGLRFERLPSP